MSTRILSAAVRVLKTASASWIAAAISVPPRGIDVHVERVERFAERVVVERDRALQKRIAGERDQTDAVAVEFATRSCTASFARVSRSGFTSCASMLFEVSTAKRSSSPLRCVSCHSKPACGRASATKSSATPRVKSARFERRREVGDGRRELVEQTRARRTARARRVAARSKRRYCHTSEAHAARPAKSQRG